MKKLSFDCVYMIKIQVCMCHVNKISSPAITILIGYKLRIVNYLKTLISTNLILLELPFSIALFFLRQNFHQRIATTNNTASTPAAAIPTTAPTDRLLPVEVAGGDGGIKSANEHCVRFELSLLLVSKNTYINVHA